MRHNEVGKKINEGMMKTWLQELDRLDGALAPYGIELTAAERRRRLHLRDDAGEVLTRVADLAEDVGVKLPSSTVDDMRRDARSVDELQGVVEALVGLQALIRDTLAQAEHEAWSAAQAYYTGLHRLAPTNSTIERRLAPIARFFAKRQRAPVGEEPEAEEPPPRDAPPNGPIGTV
jgi:hypothetical protein